MFVVTGATGNVGRALVKVLEDGGEKVTGVSRQGSGVRADLADPASLKGVLDGAEALFLLVAGEDPAGILEVAKAGGVRRVVLLSSQGAGTRPDVYRHPRLFEEAVQESGLEWTILRPTGFASNALAWAESIRTERTAAAPFAEVGLPVIDPDDIADVAAVVLREGRPGSTYELTGPEPITPRERARAIGDALGAPVRFVEQSRDEARAQMLHFMPEPVVEGTLAILGEPLPEERRAGPDVARILQRPARSFADWAARNVQAFR